eukprot:scaffold207799_cov22-Prasinocladus_malaysianus.AAC.2
MSSGANAAHLWGVAIYWWCRSLLRLRLRGYCSIPGSGCSDLLLRRRQARTHTATNRFGPGCPAGEPV